MWVNRGTKRETQQRDQYIIQDYLAPACIFVIIIRYTVDINCIEATEVQINTWFSLRVRIKGQIWEILEIYWSLIQPCPLTQDPTPSSWLSVATAVFAVPSILSTKTDQHVSLFQLENTNSLYKMKNRDGIWIFTICNITYIFMVENFYRLGII